MGACLRGGTVSSVFWLKHSTTLKDFDWARLAFELDSYMDEVHILVRAIYRE